MKIVKYIRKQAFSFLLFLLSINLVSAQSFDGNWSGTVQGSQGSLPAELTMKTATNAQLSGQMNVFSNGLKDVYVLKGNVSQGNAKGTLTYKDGTVFSFAMQLNNGQIKQTLSYNNQVILNGNFAKAGTAVATTSPVKADGLYRDPNLVGKWTNQENYSSGGGFYGGSSTSIILNADGTIDDGGSNSYVSGPNSSGNSSGGGNSAIAQVKAAGARWFTKGNILYWRVNVNGKMTDVPNSKYYIERGALLLTDVNTGKKLLYYKGK
jgi:hypothetical protein